MDNTELILVKIQALKLALCDLEKLLIRPNPVPAVATTPVKRAEMALPASFEAFWASYPKKVGKMAAFRAWKIHVARGHEDAVTSALKGQLRQTDWIKEGGKYIPHPATWINQHRWLDEIRGGNNGLGKYGEFGQTV